MSVGDVQFQIAVGENGVHLAGDIREVYWGSAAFFILLVLLVWKVGPRVKGALAGRTERIRKELAEAQQQRIEAENSLEAQSKELPDLGQERSRIRHEAIESAEKLKADIAERARIESAELVQKGKDDCENIRRQAVLDLQAEISAITKTTTEAIVLGDIDNDTQRDLIDSYIDRVGHLT